MIITLNKQFVNIESIWLELQCPSCQNVFNVKMKAPFFNKNCRCRHVTFYFALTTMKGSRVSVKVEAQEGYNQPVEIHPFGWSIDED